MASYQLYHSFYSGNKRLQLYKLPIFDFRPYHIGADIKKGMEIPSDAEAPQYETTFILKKGDVQKEFTLNDYPDSSWTFVDSKDKTR